MGKVLNYNGFQYTLKRERSTAVEWRCRSRKCTSTLSLSRDNTLVAREPSQHISSCLCGGSKVIIDQALDKMKKRSREETTTIPKIYAQEIVSARLANPGMPTGLYFPTLNSIYSTLYYHRFLNYPALPKNLEDLTIMESWRLSKFGEPFLLVDETCVSRGIQFNPQRLTCDFEPAAIKTFSSTFPTATTHACFFHYSQALWQKLRDLKLARLVTCRNINNKAPEEQHKSAKYWFHGAIGLALIPPSLIENT
ncbi:unnamed protein product [Rotaria sp. Silwood2]|nr:unnamed protein product [Rotaria sp. Silwood2]CAF4062521.1 unnamed protein product [Rotaria sp. Silwood2]